MRYRRQYWGLPGIWALFAGFGILGIAGGLVAPSPRDVLVSLGATGLFAGLVLYLITPPNFVSASIIDRIHDVQAKNMVCHVPDAERQCEFTYLPNDEAEPGDGSVLLFVPHENGDTGSGTMMYPTGDALLAEFEDGAVGSPSDSPVELARQIVDGLENGLEFVNGASSVVDPSKRRATIEIRESVVGTIGRFDDPITSFVGAAFATGLHRPVTVSIQEDNGSATITCRWEQTTLTNGRVPQRPTVKRRTRSQRT